MLPIHNPEITDGAPLPSRRTLPDRLLYSIAADIGGSGLSLTAEQGLLASHRSGFLGRAIGYRDHQKVIPSEKIRSLAWHPVKLLSNLDRETYYGAKKQYLDWITSREIRRGGYDCFHGWSGDCLRSLIAARQMKVPTMIEIPTWHRNKFRPHKFYTKSERERPDTWRNRLRVHRQQILTEYELADLILVQSETAAASFLDKGFDPGRIFLVARGADPDTFRPARYPETFRLTFVGALKKRKGVHHLLEAWHRLDLKDAELVLVGTVHDEIKPWLERHKIDSVILPGFVADVRPYLERSSAFVFTSECEGSAKATYEAAASALAQITTRESGDVVVNGHNGIVIPANDSNALADAIRECYRDRDALAAMGRAARRRFEERFTWEHHRRRLLHAYAMLAAGSAGVASGSSS